MREATLAYENLGRPEYMTARADLLLPLALNAVKHRAQGERVHESCTQTFIPS